MSGKWESSWATEHPKECHGQYAFLSASRIFLSHIYMYKRKIREALEIGKLRTINEKDKNVTVLNRDNDD